MGIKERKEREREARKDEILGAAEKVFFEKGTATATMDEVAEAAELSKGTLYLYYKRKEDLCMGITCRGMGILAGLFEKAVSTGEPTVTLIQNLGDAYYQYFRSYRNYFRMSYFFENPDHRRLISPEMIEECSVLDEKIWDYVVGTIQKGINEGVFLQGLNAREAAVILWSNSYGIMRLMDREDRHMEEHMGLDLRLVLRRSTAMLLYAMLSPEERPKHELLAKEFEQHQEQE